MSHFSYLSWTCVYNTDDVDIFQFVVHYNVVLRLIIVNYSANIVYLCVCQDM